MVNDFSWGKIIEAEGFAARMSKVNLHVFFKTSVCKDGECCRTEHRSAKLVCSSIVQHRREQAVGHDTSISRREIELMLNACKCGLASIDWNNCFVVFFRRSSYFVSRMEKDRTESVFTLFKMKFICPSVTSSSVIDRRQVNRRRCTSDIN